jgi:DNA-binding GntR family transcriptional regulator
VFGGARREVAQGLAPAEGAILVFGADEGRGSLVHGAERGAHRRSDRAAEDEGLEPRQVARHLGVSVNAPVADVRRVFTGPKRRVIYLAEVTYRGDFVHLEIDLKS